MAEQYDAMEVLDQFGLQPWRKKLDEAAVVGTSTLGFETAFNISMYLRLKRRRHFAGLHEFLDFFAFARRRPCLPPALGS